MKRIILLVAAAAICFQSANAQIIDINTTYELSPYVFGHNLEHTRAAVNGGLSAQMIRNRKFAGKPSKNEGVAVEWTGIGEKTLFLHDGAVYTKHIGNPQMRRNNELRSQTVQNLIDGQLAGIFQGGLYLIEGKKYEIRIVTDVNTPLPLKVELTDRSGDKILASKTINLDPEGEWPVNEMVLTPSATDKEGCLRLTFTKKAQVVFGSVSMMPEDNFHGMRTDVIADLKAIGPRLMRWPGGNFAGEYRWKDGLLPVDQRGPLQAATEIETQPYTYGFDLHEIDTDDFIALCREVGAEPMITINLAWSSPEESAQWVEYCNGGEDTEYGKIRIQRGHREPYNVKFWSLGNEMGYGHMEGPSGPEGYAELAGKHADAMLKVTPDLELCSSGPYPNDNWATYSAAPLADKVRYISLHHYAGGSRSFTTPEDIKRSYEETVSSFQGNINQAKRMRESLDATGKKLHISFDEWNQWYSWYRPSSVTEGIYAARTMHFYISESSALDIPSTVWTQYQTSLADYAGKKVRLAVHYISYDTFFLQLDDFTVGPEDGEAPFVDYGNVLRYDIYVDGTKVGESQTPTYTLSGLTEGTHIVGIVAVYPNGDSPMGTITITVTAIARVTLDNGSAATLHTITGQKVGGDLSRQQRGIYIIQQGNQYKKTIKR